IRLLANIESASEKLLSIILVGQPELAARLNQPSLRQLKQRIGLRCSLSPLTMEETSAYIAARVRVAGGDAERIFTNDAIVTIQRANRQNQMATAAAATAVATADPEPAPEAMAAKTPPAASAASAAECVAPVLAAAPVAPAAPLPPAAPVIAAPAARVAPAAP